MGDRSAKDRPGFRRSLAGYRRADVDRYVSDVERARSAWSAEIERLRKVEPLARLGDDIAELLTSFASAVVSVQDRLTEDAQRQRAEAEEYAARRMADADRLLEMARQQARELAGDMIRQAQSEIAVLADQQLTIADALERAAQGIAVSKEAIAKIHPPANAIPQLGRENEAGAHAADAGDDRLPARWASG
jgi:cell division septum initiation protein DivIVA